MKKAVMFGGGNIGRGFIGAVLAEAGYHITFADVNMELINKLNELGTYTVHIVDVECKEQVVTEREFTFKMGDVKYKFVLSVPRS